MINFTDSIDVSIFMSMQISKKCLELGNNRPVLFLSNPGIGKSTAVELFSKVNGYDEILLRISNETPDTITGYDIAPDTKSSGTTSAVHIRPSWFQRILDNSEKGIKSVLFLDEITTSDAYTQGAALNIVFDRRCHSEYLPSDTLIVAAGNYAQNLTSEMTILAPMLNRFMVVNLIPSAKDIDHFLCRFDGSITGSTMNFEDEITKVMFKLKAQEKTDIDKATVNIIGEMFSNAIKTETKMLCKEGILDLKVTDLKDIYSDVDNDDPVANYFSLRSMNYLLDASIACYLCFGKDGILSDNFKKIVHGTVGICISRNNNKEIVKSIVTDRYFDTLTEAANDIEKFSDKKLPKYKKFITDLIDGKSKLEIPEVSLINKKLCELNLDKDIESIERPIEPEIISAIFSKLLGTLKDNCYSKVDFSNKGEEVIQEELTKSPETYAGFVTAWNVVAELVSNMEILIKNPKKNYNRDVKESLNTFLSHSRIYSHQLKLIRRIFKRVDEALCETIPQPNPMSATSK